jgi:hypothetical protein
MVCDNQVGFCHMQIVLTINADVCRSGGGGGASEKGLTAGFRGINAICDRLALVKIIRDRACEVFKKVCCHKCCRHAQASARRAPFEQL